MTLCPRCGSWVSHRMWEINWYRCGACQYQWKIVRSTASTKGTFEELEKP